MILTVLALGGTILGATTVAGLLMLYQIRQSTDLENSAKAIFAADAGIEWALYKFVRQDEALQPPAFSNNASLSVVCLDGAESEILCHDEGLREVRSVGRAGGSSRAFRLTL